MATVFQIYSAFLPMGSVNE